MTAIFAHDAATRLAQDFASDVRAGLLGPAKRLPCRWLYDELGSSLFEEICEVPDYYVTAAEQEILDGRVADIVRRLPQDVEVVEFGCGSGRKTRRILDAVIARDGCARYVPVDISPAALATCVETLSRGRPDLEIDCVVGDYEDGIQRLRDRTARPRLVLWLGSNIGNFARHEAAAFLRRVVAGLTPHDRLLVGIDLRKDRSTLERAYDDVRGVTARFNRNLLARINRELGGEFAVDRFRHQAVYHEHDGRVEMRLVATQAMRVAIAELGIEVDFARGESIHTEDSYKYSLAEIADLAAESCVTIEKQWFDRRWYYGLNLLAP
jgi:L-histidine Nalpha-methyltransferase